MCSRLTRILKFCLAKTECTSTVFSPLHVWKHTELLSAASVLQNVLFVLWLQWWNIRMYWLCPQGRKECSAEQGWPWGNLLSPCSYSFILFLCLSRRVSFTRTWESSRDLLLLLPRRFHPRRGSSGGKRVRSTTWVTTPSPTSSESLTPS